MCLAGWVSLCLVFPKEVDDDLMRMGICINMIFEVFWGN